MKSIKNLLATLAFVFAFGAAFALDTNSSSMINKFGVFDSTCSSAPLNENNCGLTVTGFGRCTVTSGTETVVAWDKSQLGSCIDALYKQTP